MIKWGLVAHTVAMFSFITIPATTNLSLQSVSYVDNRGFHDGGVFPPGPLGYQDITELEPHRAYYRGMFPPNRWLADGFMGGSISQTVAWVFDVYRFPSSTVVMLSIP